MSSCGWKSCGVKGHDTLCKVESKKWIFQGLQPLPPEYSYCLLHLSLNGGDYTEIREFDLVAKCFVKGGFNVPAGKSQVSWIDQNMLFIVTDFGSGYVRMVKRWRQGQPLNIAETLYEAQHEDMEVMAAHLALSVILSVG